MKKNQNKVLKKTTCNLINKEFNAEKKPKNLENNRYKMKQKAKGHRKIGFQQGQKWN